MARLDISADAPHIQVRGTNAHDESGAGLFATISFWLGDTIAAISAPMIVALDKDRLADTCYHCFRQAGDVPYEAHLGFLPDGSTDQEVREVRLNRCAGCKVVRYCGKICQKSSWAAHHSLECPVFKAVHPDILPNHIRAMLRLLLLRTAGRIRAEDWASLMACASHFEEFQDVSQRAELAKLKSMAKMVRNFAGGMVEEDEVLSLLLRVKINSLTLQTPFHDPLGLALHPLLAKINHSCNPNSYIRCLTVPPQRPPKTAWRLNSDSIILTPLRSISPDEEITISYIDETMPVHQRIHDLQHRYFFTCDCSKCTSEQQHDAGFPTQERTLIHTVQDTTRTQLDRLSGAAGSVPTQPTRFLHDHLRTLIGPADLPWQVNWYPLPQLLNSLILAHLDSRQYNAALRLACLRHFVVNPRVYAAATHPIRLTHAFVLVRLMGLLAGGGGGVDVVPAIDDDVEHRAGPKIYDDNDENDDVERHARTDIAENADLSYWLPRLIGEFLGNAKRTWKGRGERWDDMYMVVEQNLGSGVRVSDAEGRRKREQMERWCGMMLDKLLGRTW